MRRLHQLRRVGVENLRNTPHFIAFDPGQQNRANGALAVFIAVQHTRFRRMLEHHWQPLTTLHEILSQEICRRAKDILTACRTERCPRSCNPQREQQDVFVLLRTRQVAIAYRFGNIQFCRAVGKCAQSIPDRRHQRPFVCRLFHATRVSIRAKRPRSVSIESGNSRRLCK